MTMADLSKLWKDLVIIVIGAVCVFVTLRFGDFRARWQERSLLIVGSHMSVPGETSSVSHRDLVILGSDTCRYSRESVAFDRKLVAAASSLNLPVHIISPNKSSMAWYAVQLSLPSSSFIVHDLSSLGIRGTPTVILRDEKGFVEGLWEGRLPPTGEDTVLSRISRGKHLIESPHFEQIVAYPEGQNGQKPSLPQAPPRMKLELNESDVSELRANHMFLDLRERDAVVRVEGRNEVNIPLVELDVRARIELDPNHPVIIDCSLIDVGTCDIGALK